MSNRFKLKKTKEKVEETDNHKELKESKHGAKFMKNKQEKGTITSNFTGKSSKEYSKKKI